MWWDNLSTFQQVMFMFAVPATVILIIFLVLMLIGISDDFDDVDFDIQPESLANIGGLKVFTLRGTLVFFSVGGWVAFILDDGMKAVWAGLLGIVAGAIGAFLMALALRAAMKLESVGNLDYHNAIGKNGSVYIRVPKKRSGKGKVNVTFQGRFMEMDAVTDDEEDIHSGLEIEVTGVLNESTVIVSKHTKGGV